MTREEAEWEEENMRNITDMYDYPASHSCGEECDGCVNRDSDGECIAKYGNIFFVCHGEKYEPAYEDA